MRHTLPLAGRFLTGSLLLAISFGAFGCGDSGTVNPEAELSRLTVSPGTLQPGFNSGTTQYSVDLTSSTTSVTVSAQPAVSGDSVTINGQATTSRVITLGAAGTTTSVNIVVSESGSNSRTYTVLLRRAGLAGNNSLESLVVTPGTLAPTFNANELIYTVDVANTDGSVSVTPTFQDTNATMTVNGQNTDSGQARSITLNPAGQSTAIRVIVTAQNGTQKTYLLTVSRGISANNNLQSLTISPGTLTPVFNAGTLDYTVNVASTVGSVSITPTRQDPDATIAVNGQAAISGQARTVTLNAPGQSTPIRIEVTAQNRTPKTYLVNVSRGISANNNLQNLTISPSTLTPAFNAGTLDYTVNVASTVGSVSITPTRQDTDATITVNGQAATSGQAQTITLRAAGLSTLIPIVVTAQNGTQRTYLVEVIRAALGGNNNLQSLAVSPGPLAPAFSANTTSYSVDVGSGVTSISVTPTLQDATATMTVNGQAATSGQGRAISLNGAGANTVINIVVTAPNSNQKTYTVTVNRAALASNNNLSALSVTPGSLAPNFAAGTLSYTVGVASDVTSVNVSATKADPNAVMSGPVTAGTGVVTGQAAIPLNGAGTSTSVAITVTAPNGTSKTYTITVNRAAPAAPAAPPAPASAPDLIPEDDSCLPDPNNNNQCSPGTSNQDNITNVATPSFTVAQPGAGETPNLYVDGVKVKEGFDQGANTLTPTTALSDGDHTITSTVTNAAGSESPQSPALTVTIDTGAPGTPTP